MSKQNKKMNNLEVNEQTIANSERIMKMLAQRGIISDKNIDGEKMKNVGQEKKYHNTLLLLKNYRTIAWVLECFPDTLAEELEQPFEGLDELLDRFDAEMGMENRKLENRMMSVQKSRLMIDRVNVICTPKVRHFWRCIFLWQRKDKNIENTRQNSNYLL